MAVTTFNQLVNPQVLQDMISATLPKKIKFARVSKIDRTLVGRGGDTITVPTWGWIGEASEHAENSDIDLEQMHTQTITATIKSCAKGVEITDKAMLCGHGDVMGEAARQIAVSLASKVDSDSCDVLSNNSLVYDGTSAKISYSSIVMANSPLADENDSALNKVIYIHPEQEADLLKDSDFIAVDKAGTHCMVDGYIGKIAGDEVCKSKKIKKIEYDIKSASTEGYTQVTSGNFSTYAGKYGKTATANQKAIAVGDYVSALTTPYWLDLVIVLDAVDPNESDGASITETGTGSGQFGVGAPALTIYMKRDVEVESDRDIVKKNTVITADNYYVPVVTNASKVCVAKIKA